MAFVLHAAALVNVASGLLMALLGMALLAVNPRKDWNRIFALMVVFWGAQIITVNAVRLTTDQDLARLAGGVSLAFLIPVYFFAAAFADVFPRASEGWRSGALLALLALPALVSLVLLFVAPASLLAEVQPVAEGGFTLRWGPLFPYLVVAPLFGALFYALFRMMQRLEEAGSTIERTQVTFVLAALALFVAHVTPSYLVAFAGSVPYLGGATEADPQEAGLFVLIMLGGLVLLAVLAARLWATLRNSKEPQRSEARLVLRAIGLGLGSAVLFITLSALGGPDIEAIGLVRVGSVALIVYAITRYQLFDLDLRVKSFAAAATAGLAVLVIGAAVWVALRQVAFPGDVGGVLIGVVALVAFLPVLRLASRVVDRVAPQVSREGDHLYLRKLEVYRASVESALREGRAPTETDDVLAEQRRRLGLTERDHGIVVSLASTRAEPAAAAPDLRPGGVAFGKYVIDSVLAEGGFGRIFLARDRVLGRNVVIKELLAKWRGNVSVVRTFLQEARIAGQLSHPHIVAVHEVEQHGQDHYVVMEHCPGGSLAERLRDSGSLPPAEALRIASEVLEALEAAHGRGVVHRDVKPDNILFGPRGEAKLADFGIATLADDDVQHTIGGLTTGRFQPGTLQYMSPEQARGRPVDARSDLYAVGAVLYRMLTGKAHLSVEGLDELAARTAIVSAGPLAPQGLAKDLHAVLARALAPRPEDRFPTAAAFRAALAAVPLPARSPR